MLDRWYWRPPDRNESDRRMELVRQALIRSGGLLPDLDHDYLTFLYQLAEANRATLARYLATAQQIDTLSDR